MGIMIGGIDPVQAIIDLELRVGILESLLEEVINGKPVTIESLEANKQKIMDLLKKKYPQLGLETKHGG